MALAGAVGLWALSSRSEGLRRRAVLLRVAATVLAAGPPLAVGALATDVTYDRAICGSALSASLDRARPGYVLDRVQSGCRDKGQAVVDGATSYGAASLAVVAGAVLVALVPGPRGRAAVAA